MTWDLIIESLPKILMAVLALLVFLWVCDLGSYSHEKQVHRLIEASKPRRRVPKLIDDEEEFTLSRHLRVGLPHCLNDRSYLPAKDPYEEMMDGPP